jgi:hypothetical protein
MHRTRSITVAPQFAGLRRDSHGARSARPFIIALIGASCSLFAGVDGVVVNGTTGKPQPNVMVSLVQPGQAGMQNIASVKSDADGKFNIDKPYAPGPVLLQSVYSGVQYTQMIPPGTPTSGLTVNVFDATTNPESGKVAQHMILIEPGPAALAISETFLCENKTQQSYSDPSKGSIQFYVPDAARGKIQVTVTAPQGMPVSRPVEKTKKPGVYKVDYPLKPGETRFDIGYALPSSDSFSGKRVDTSTPTRLVTPSSVTLTGDGLDSLGQEPQTKAHIYDVKTASFDVKIAGTGSLRTPEASDQSDQRAQGEDDDGRPTVESGAARIYSQLPWVLGLTFTILALGGVMLYRKGAA